MSTKCHCQVSTLFLVLCLTQRVDGGPVSSALSVRAVRAMSAVVSEPKRSVNQIEHFWANSEPTVTTILSNSALPPQSSNANPRQNDSTN